MIPKQSCGRSKKLTFVTKEMIATYLYLCKVFIRLDQPNTALEYYTKASENFPGEISLILGIARIYDALNDMPRGVQFYKKVSFLLRVLWVFTPHYIGASFRQFQRGGYSLFSEQFILLRPT